MSKRDVFIKEIKEAINTGLVLSEDAKNYFDALCITKENDKPQFTENGKLVLNYMQNNEDTFKNLFNAKSIGEGLSITSRTASGALRKLVTDGYVEKVGTNPVIYAITALGREQHLEDN